MQIDLEALRRSAEREDSEHAVVTRRWLRQVLADLSGRPAELDLCPATPSRPNR